MMKLHTTRGLALLAVFWSVLICVAHAESSDAEKATIEVGIGFSGTVTEGAVYTVEADVPYVCSYASVRVYMQNPGGTTGRSYLNYILSVNGFAVLKGGSSAVTLPAGVIQQGHNEFRFDFVLDTDGVTETTTVVAASSYIRIIETALPDGSFKERGQGPIVIHEGDALTFPVNSPFVCASAKLKVHTADRGATEHGVASLPYVVYINDIPVENGAGAITIPSGFIQQGDSVLRFQFLDDGDATAETTLVFEDSYIQLQQATVPDGSFRERGVIPRVLAEGDTLDFLVYSAYECAEARVQVHTVDRGGVDHGLGSLPYIVYVNGMPVENGTTTVTAPSGVIQPGVNTFTLAFQNDGDALAETTLLLEDSSIQVLEETLAAGSFRERGQGPTVIHEGNTLTFTVNSPDPCSTGKVWVHSADRGGIEYGRTYLNYILKVNGLAVLKGGSSACTIPSGVLQQGDNTVALEFLTDTDAYAETTLVLEDSYIQVEPAPLPEGAFKYRGRGPVVVTENGALTFSLNLADPAVAGKVRIHAADRGAVGNGTTTIKYDLKVNGATVLTSKSFNTEYAIPTGSFVAGANTFEVYLRADTDGKVETALALEDSYIYMPRENWPDADADDVPDYIEGGAERDADSDGTPDYLDTDSDDDGFLDGDEYRSGYSPYDPSSIPVDLLLLDATLSSSFWHDNTLDLLLAPVTFMLPDESGNPPYLPPFVVNHVAVEPSSLSASVSVEEVQGSPKPLSVVMLFDGSDSLRTTDKDKLRVAAGKEFVSRLRVGDEAAVFEFPRFDPSPEMYWSALYQGLTSDHTLLNTALDRLSATGNTPLYQAVHEAVLWLDAQRQGDSWQRIVVLFSDGEPNTDTYRDAAIQLAQELRIPVVTVGLGESATPGTEAADVMRGLAEQTHGIYVPAAGPEALANIYASLAEGLLGTAYQMELVFSPHPPEGTAVTVTVYTNYGDAVYQFAAPGIPDNDGDGLLDNEEDLNGNGVVDAGETNPFNADTDGDGINDYDEIHTYHSDPTEPDSDGDGASDGEESNWGSNPTDDEELPPNLTSMTVGQLTIEAEQLVDLGSNRVRASGYVRINHFLRCSADLTIDRTALTVTGSGEWFAKGIPYVPGGEVRFYSGAIAINAGTALCAGLNAAASLLDVVGLGVELESFKFITGGVEISGTLELPDAIDASIEIEQLQVTSSGGIEFAGTIQLPDVEFEGFPWGIKDAHLDLNTIENEFGGGGTLSTPKFDVIIEKITIRNGRLETVIVGIGFPDPGINLDGSGVVWLQSITGGLIDMAPGPPPLKIKAACQLTIGPEVLGYSLITGVPEIQYDTSGMFDATGTLYLFGGPDEGYEVAQVLAHFGTPGSSEPGFRFGATAHLWPEVFDPEMSFSIDFDNRFEGTAEGTFDLGNVDLDVLGETVADLVGTALEVLPAPTMDLRCSLTNDGFSGSFAADVLAGDIEFTVTIEPGGLPSLDASFDLAIDIDWPWKMDPASLAAYAKAFPGKAVIGTFVMPSGLRKVLVTLKHTEGSGELTLIAPDSTEFTPGGADGIRYGYASNPRGCFSFYVLNNPLPGTWQVEIANPDELGAITAQVLPVNTPPTVAVVSAKSLSSPTGRVVIGYTATDPDDAATVALYYDNNKEGFDGLTIIEGLPEADGYAEYAWDTTTAAPGRYYVYAKVSDGVNAPRLAYLDHPIDIVHDTSVPSPTGLALDYSDGAIEALWNAAKSDALLSYRVYWMEEGADPGTAHSEAVGSGNSFSIPAQAGRTYRVWVTMVNGDGAESAPSASRTITALAGAGDNNPPDIVSEPPKEVAATSAYTYDVQAQDADHDDLTFAVATAPAGMTIHQETGVINWTPSAAQRGVHDVAVTVSDPNGGIDTQAFRLTVTAAPNPDGDGDGLDLQTELKYGADPEQKDSDGDGLDDGLEVNVYHTNPANPDTDGDGVNDGEEVATGGDPLHAGAARQGSLRVVLEPAGALDAGVQWSVDGGPWRYSGQQFDDLSEGSHTVTFKTGLGWIPPDDETIQVASGATAEVTGAYTANPAGRADVNGDRSVDALDVQLVINAVLGLSVNAISCDINADTSIDALDVQLVINAVLGYPVR